MNTLITPTPASGAGPDVTADLDSLSGATQATSIEGNDVRLRFSKEEVAAMGNASSADYPLSNFPDNK